MRVWVDWTQIILQLPVSVVWSGEVSSYCPSYKCLPLTQIYSSITFTSLCLYTEETVLSRRCVSWINCWYWWKCLLRSSSSSVLIEASRIILGLGLLEAFRLFMEFNVSDVKHFSWEFKGCCGLSLSVGLASAYVLLWVVCIVTFIIFGMTFIVDVNISINDFIMINIPLAFWTGHFHILYDLEEGSFFLF